MTQRDFSRKLGVSHATVARIEIEHQNISLKTLEQLCKALKCDIGDLFD